MPPTYALAVPWWSKMTASKGLPAATITAEGSATHHLPWVMSSKKSCWGEREWRLRRSKKKTQGKHFTAPPPPWWSMMCHFLRKVAGYHTAHGHNNNRGALCMPHALLPCLPWALLQTAESKSRTSSALCRRNTWLSGRS